MSKITIHIRFRCPFRWKKLRYDPFYSKEKMARLRESIRQIESTIK